MEFTSADEMKEYFQGTWLSENDQFYLVFNNGQYYRHTNSAFNSSFFRMQSEIIENGSKKYSDITFEDFYKDEFIDSGYHARHKIEFESSKGIAKSSDSKVFIALDDGNISDDGTISNDDGKIYRKISEDVNYVEDLLKSEFDESIKELIFNEKYPNLPTSREVQYDKYGHLFDNFIITGTAELDDYYNWGYENYEYAYFCIQITPSAGSFSDRWYVYAERNKFADLYSSLQSGSKNVTLVAQMIFVDTGSNNMATLVDYK